MSGSARTLALSLLSLLALGGCNNGPATDTDDPPTGVDTDTDSPFGGDEGSLALVREYDGGQLVSAEVLGLFMNDDQGFVNAAQCARSEESPCLRELPEPGGRIEYDATDRFVLTSSSYRYVGLDVTFGPYQAPYEVLDDVSRYFLDVTDREAASPVSGPADIALGVQWGDFDAPGAVTVPPGLNVITPRSTSAEIVFSDDTAFRFEWEPAEPGLESRMVLLVRDEDPQAPAFVYDVPDTGSYDFDVSTLGLVGDRDLAVQLARWSVDTLDVNGNTLNVQSTAQSTFFIRYIDVGNRLPIPPIADVCEDDPAPLADGGYYGDLTPLANDYEEAACLQSFDAANGRDGVVALDVPPQTELSVAYRQLGSNAAMYLYDDCVEEPVCVVGADLVTGIGGTEVLQIFNPSPTATEEYFLVLDADEPVSGGLFFLEIFRELIPDPEAADTCIEALGLPDTQPGTYYQADWVGFFNEVNPGLTGCTGTALTGPDAILPVIVPDQATIELTLDMPDGNPAMYLLGQCNNVNTCIDGVDQPGETEVLVYQNTSGATQALDLVIDTANATQQPYTLTINIF
jgi:hypothetical protein